MGIDIYKKGEKYQRLYALTDELYDTLQKPIFEKLENKTGVFIDNYGKTTLTYQHAKLLVQILDNFSPTNKVIIKEIKFLNNFLIEMVQDKVDLDFVGD